MENTITNYTTNRTLMAYYKSNIDVQINWLLFLNSFKSISNKKSFMEVAPILEEIRIKAYTAFEDDLVPDNTKQVNNQIKNMIGKLLDEYGVSDAKTHIEENITEQDIINLSTATFIRQEVSSLKIDEFTKYEDYKFISLIVKNLKNEKIKTSIVANGISKELLEYYLESLRISSSEDYSLQNYIYTVLELVKGIELMSNKILEDNGKIISANSRFIINELIDNSFVISNYSLSTIFEQINEVLEKIATLSEEDKISLKKHI